jgi:lipopolysaccharide/colanic/teichoic acid biosynthesis glycosyltransferase
MNIREVTAESQLIIMRKIQLFIKRITDIIFASVGLFLVSPLILCIALLIKITSKGTVFFCQERVGKNGVIFKLYKFRTMVPNAVNIGTGLTTAAGDSRITPIGRFLRKASLDELPQLFNVLKGDISFVGPRPTIPQHLEYYGDFERRRLEMKPGITGLAMIKGRNRNPWSVRIKYDIEYIEKFSLRLDFVILLKTVWVVVSGKDTYYDYEKNGPAFDLIKNEQKGQMK